MNKTNFLQIFAIVAFVVLMGVSCWATVESLHLLLPSWPVIAFWAVAVIFFVIAAIGTKLIVDSLNQKLFIDNRGWRILAGLALLLAFWLCFFLPTNTHTFFYRASIKDLLIRDLTETKGKLQDLANEGQAGKIISQEKADFRHKIDAIFSKFAAEINNPGDPGWKDKAESVIIELEAELGKIQRLKLKCQSFQCRQELIKAMREHVENLLDSKLKSTYDTRLANINQGLDKPAINKLIFKIEAVQTKIDNHPTNNDEPTEETTTTLSQAYKIIEKYSDILITEFEKKYPREIKNTIEDKKVYAGVSKTERMLSVIDIWKDFFARKYSGRGFVFWIIIAALVDIAGFIFFDIAFAKKEY
ncbi:MAG: hypothetical protein ABI851_11385 [Saprospiraceae bacterium]